MSATNVEQLNRNFYLDQIASEAVSEHENAKKKFWGGMPPDPPKS